MTRWLVVLALVGPWLATPGCTRLVDDRVGNPCEASEDCNGLSASTLECVLVDDDEGICVGAAERGPASCDDDDDCLLAADGRFPVEARCVDGTCGCFAGVPGCFNDDGDSLVLEPETCRCVPLGGEGDPCLSPLTCASGLACDGDGQCRSGAAAGAFCRDGGDCVSGSCAGQVPSGTCRGVAGDDCSSVQDCASPLVCEDGVCAEDGDTGALCRVDSDCVSFECNVGACS